MHSNSMAARDFHGSFREPELKEDSDSEEDGGEWVCRGCWSPTEDGECVNDECELYHQKQPPEYRPSELEVAQIYFGGLEKARREGNEYEYTWIIEDRETAHLAERYVFEKVATTGQTQCSEQTLLTLGTFNTWRLGKRTDGTNRDFPKIADELKGCSIVALQEVQNSDGVELLLKQLPSFKYSCSKTSTKKNVQSRQADFFAFLYDKELWSCDEEEYISSPLVSNPNFSYVPYKARFCSTKSKNVTISIISVHLTLGHSKSCAKQREHELKEVFEYVSTKTTPEDPFWVVMGDMNIKDKKEGEALDEMLLYSFRFNKSALPTNHFLAKKGHPYDDAMTSPENLYGQDDQKDYREECCVTQPFTPKAPPLRISMGQYRSKFSDHHVCTFQIKCSASWKAVPTEQENEKLCDYFKEKLSV